ncbi:ATP synthase subunit B [Sphingobium sp. C100]|jgi:F-type H+-transporting ATPase subunit b|uniref:F0F1 ATP synthase subunit B family protein n=1 Tax=Sphingobium sp. C100 TaxID=1207055 RepID=UPI0003D5AF87|nr:ATP synthase subunit B [Sphingobium sp. C100]ETI64159.1 ATP synthase subunit B [Sphingobium sp. C100]
MAEAAAQQNDATAPSLREAIHAEGLEPVGTVAHEGVEPHTDPKAVGMDATAWVSLAMAVFILILLVKKVPALIGRALDGRIAQIKEQLAEASRLRAEAEALKGEYEAKLAAAAGEAEAMRKAAEHEAEGLIADARVNAEALVVRRQKMAEDKIGAAERAAIAGIRAKAVNAATSAAAALIVQGHDAKADKALVDSAIGKLGTIN